jgi:hypothetical protein
MPNGMQPPTQRVCGRSAPELKYEVFLGIPTATRKQTSASSNEPQNLALWPQWVATSPSIQHRLITVQRQVTRRILKYWTSEWMIEVAELLGSLFVLLTRCCGCGVLVLLVLIH